ncbi:hypothetical protein C7457_0178 [Thermovibrio guaymasensis]|uniref:Uncharacterized protein n=1 Tax=Thermovibrio guaymasensis TaxID=240167 RepID=A0A420W7K9_9BACT|nr:cytochrome c3 family protein [Thermovibrio guaymasensis]RKQ63311.1 hypothetical protein C7457_0178 [Thermovibrio guaymasensis]
MAPEVETNPGLVDLTTPEYAGKCGICHPGGGPMEKDRQDNFLYEKSLFELQSEFDAGKILGDYAVLDKSTGKFVPFEWTLEINKRKINNTAPPTCFYCHSRKALENGIDTAATGTYMYRKTLKGKLFNKKYFAAIDTAGGLLGSINKETGEIEYDLSLFDSDNNFIGSNIVGKSDNACGHCHGVFQFEDFDNDGKITPLDFVKAAKDQYKFKHPDGMKEALVWQFSEGSKNYDVHKLNGVGCVDCHSSVPHEYIGSGYFPSSNTLTPSHDFAKGNAGPAFGVMWSQLAGSLTCTKCHNAKTIHEGVFGPSSYTDVHLEKVACTTCHIAKKYFYRVKLVDWTLPLFVFDGTTNNKVVDLDKHGYLYGDPANGKSIDIALFPERDFKTGEVKWKYKPANAMGVLLFEDNSSGEFKPVFARYLKKAFKLDWNLPTKYLKVELDPSTGKPRRINGAIDPQTGKPIKILSMKAVKGGIIANDSDIISGKWVLWRAVPNYIDVNLNGQYDEGVDVQITDDTGLSGSPDGDPEINTKVEVEAAINTLKKIISSATGKSDVEVKVVATADAFGMSHNIKYASEALDCADCHGGSRDGVLTGPIFTQKTPLYFDLSEIEGQPYFDKKVDRAPTELEYANLVQEELVKAGYPSPESETTTTTETGQTTSQEGTTSETSGGGGGGGCSMAASGGSAGLLSFLIAVSPLALLRRKRS